MVTVGRRRPSVSHQESFGFGYQPSAQQPRTTALLLPSFRVMTGEEAAPGGKVRVMTRRRLHLGVGLGL